MHSLEQLANEFESWRKRKKSLGEKTPEALLAAAAALAAVKGEAPVCKTLKITKQQLQSYRGQSKEAPPRCTVLEVTAPHLPMIELTLPSGVRLAASTVEVCVALLSALNLGGGR
jgi:hypothetical protein